MARWEPNARERLEAAARELFTQRGYAETTVGDIAARAGLTERTFFRHYADKREVLFDGSDAFEAGLVAAVADAPADAGPLDAVAAALEAAARFIDGRGAAGRERQAILMANPELMERELIKLTRLGEALAAGLRERGVGDPEAGVAAETGMAILRVAVARWHADPDGPALAAVTHEAFDALRAVAARPA